MVLAEAFSLAPAIRAGDGALSQPQVCVERATIGRVRQPAAESACNTDSPRLSGRRLNANHEGVAHG